MTSKTNIGFGAGSLVYLLLAGILFAACGRDQVLADQFVPIPDRSWEDTYRPEIDIHVKDRPGPYRVYINLRHTDNYRFANIYLLVHQQRGSDAAISKRVELTLAEPDGRWTGQHSGNLYTSQQLVWDHYFFPDTGVYTLSLEQNMRENPLQHIVAAGLRVELVQETD